MRLQVSQSKGREDDDEQTKILWSYKKIKSN